VRIILANARSATKRHSGRALPQFLLSVAHHIGHPSYIRHAALRKILCPAAFSAKLAERFAKQSPHVVL